MESNFYSDEFEQLIREKTEQYKMYPSEKAWKGVYSSLHTKKRWFIAGMSVLVTGIIVIAGKELIGPSGHAGNTANTKKSTLASTAANTRSPQENTALPVAFSEYKAGPHADFYHNGQGSGLLNDEPALDEVRNLSVVDPVTGRPDPDPDAVAATGVDGPVVLVSLAPSGQANEPIAGSGIHTSTISGAADSKPAGAYARYLSRLRMGIGGQDPLASVDMNLVPDLFPGTNPAPGFQIPLHQSAYSRALFRARAAEEAEATVAADAVAVIVDTVSGPQRINWLQDYAVYSLTPASHKSDDLMEFFITPTLTFRTLAGGAYQNPKAANGAPAPPRPTLGRPMTIADYKVNTPALGFASGTNLVHKVGRNLSLKVGLQFNYTRFSLKAFIADPKSSNSLPPSDSAASVTTLASSGSQQVQYLHNEYYELSAPIGVQLRILGNDRWQLNVAASVQPSYLINNNSYLLTPDYSHYSTDPGTFRKWNVNAGIETFLTYRINKEISILAGPEFRYQIFSSYSNQYPIRENLQQYGLKVGFTKSLP
ncbi:MAG: hypothetical protein Q8927_01625 [Bacteroidota bacterium]|nr:hypothetical protein [Bacteroidota bacterium]